MNDIDFARNNAGKEYTYRGYKVKVAGYDCSGVGDCVIISGYPKGWTWGQSTIDDMILVKVNRKTDRFYYVSMDELKEIE